jgi:hypothetical protein
MELDKVALAILVTAVFGYKWCIKCGENSKEILTLQILAFYFTFMADIWWLPSALSQ